MKSRSVLAIVTISVFAATLVMGCKDLLKWILPTSIGLSTTSVSFTATAGGSNPASQPVTVSNTGGGTLSGLSTSVSYGSGSGWLTASLSATTAPATLTLQATTGSLSAGTYTATISISATGASNAPQTVAVNFSVSASSIAPSIGLSATSVSFTTTAGGSNPASQPVTVSNTGGGTLSGLSTSVSYGSGSGWLTASLSATTAPATLTLQAATGSLSAGTYTATISISATGASNTPQTVAVSFSVRSTSVTLVINEVANPWYTNVPGALEVYNEASTAVNLADYKLRTTSRTDDGSSYPAAGVQTFTLPSLSVPAGGYAVIRGKGFLDVGSGGMTLYIDDGQNDYPWYDAYSGFVELLDTTGTQTVDFVRWGTDSTAPTSTSFTFQGDAPAFPEGADYVGYTLARDVNGTNTQAAADWAMRKWSTLGGPNDVTSDTDADGDGIPDSAEVPGGTFAGLPLYQWGARTSQKDIFIHVDYMSSTDPGITPRKEALDRVKEVFAKREYALHFDVGTLYSNAANDVYNYDLDGRSHQVPYQQSVTFGTAPGYGNVLQYRADHMPIAKQRAFFYLLFGSSQNPDGSDGSGGVAYLSGNVALITLGGWQLLADTTDHTNELINFQAESVMHEFGHNLGLHHGGDEALNYKPNYFSIMNYLYSYTGLPKVGTDDDTRYYYQWYSQNTPESFPYSDALYWSNWFAPPTADPSKVGMDFSDGTGGTIDEAHVNDTLGIMRSDAKPIDFSVSGSMSADHAVDITTDLGDTTQLPQLTILHDYNDWAAINSVFQHNVMAFGVQPVVQTAVAPSAVQRSMRLIFNNPAPELSGPCAPKPARLR